MANKRFIKCEICGDRSTRLNHEKRKFMAKFPLDESRCRQWIKHVGKEDLIYVPIEKLHTLKYVCGRHFKSKDFNRKKNRLKKSAVPLINLKVDPLPDDMLVGCPCHIHPDIGFTAKKKKVSQGLCNDGETLPRFEANSGPTKLGTEPSDNEGLHKKSDASLDKPAEEYLMPDDIQETDDLVEEDEQKKVCRICLRGRTCNEELDDTLVEYYDELVYFDTYEHDALRVCLFCEHQLRRSYNFRQQSRRAHILLKAWSTDEHKKPIHELYKMLPRPTVCAKSNQKVINITFPSDNVNDENKNLINNSNDGTLDLIQDFLRTSEPNEFESEIVQHEPEIVQLEPRNVQFEPGNVKFEPRNVLFDPDNEFENHDTNANVEMNDVSLDTHKSVKGKEKNKYAKRKRGKVKINLSQLSPEERSKLKIISKSNRYVKKAALLKKGIVRLMDRGELQGIEDIGVTLDKELFLKIFDNCSFSSMLHWGVLRGRDLPKIAKLRSFLLFLLKRYNPQYETMFEVEFLKTQEQKMAEFQSRQYTKDYLEAHHKCDICYKVFEVQGLLDFHKNWHDPNSPNVCTICLMSHKTQVALKSHHFTNHQFVFRCKLCPLFTNNPYRMKTHYNDHLGAEYQCHICKKKFRNKSTMENHKRVHTTAHLCPLCAKSLQSPHGLRVHLKLKHCNESAELLASTPSVQCNQCDAAFYAEDTLSRHIAMIHKPPKPRKKHFCFFCKEEFDTLSALHRHKIRSEHRGKRRKSSPLGCASRTCPLCQEQIPSINSLALYWHYKKVHPSEPYEVQPAARNFLCEHCGKGFRARPIYEDHLNTHLGEKPYECSECGARFACRLTAKTHLESHGPPNYRCDQCPKIYKTASALYRHARNHTGERNYVCLVCTKTFSHSDRLKLHVDRVHQNKRKVWNKRKQSDQNKDEAITQDQITDETVTQDQITDETITQDQITDETITQDQITDETVIQDQITDETIIQDQITDETVIQDQITDETITQDVMTDEYMSQDQFDAKYMICDEYELCSQGVVNEEIVSSVDTDEYNEF